MASGVEMLGQMSETEALAGPVQGGNMVVKPNEVPVGGAAMLAKALRGQANKGIGGIYELPSQEPKEPQFMKVAMENLRNQMAELSPGQGGMKNYLGIQPLAKDAPRYWQSSPDSPPTELAYITDQEKELLLQANLHGSLGAGVPNQGPDGIMSLDGMGIGDEAYDQAVDQSGSEAAIDNYYSQGGGQDNQGNYNDNESSQDIINQVAQYQESSGDNTGGNILQNQQNQQAAIDSILAGGNVQTGINTDGIANLTNNPKKVQQNKNEQEEKKLKEELNVLTAKGSDVTTDELKKIKSLNKKLQKIFDANQKSLFDDQKKSVKGMDKEAQDKRFKELFALQQTGRQLTPAEQREMNALRDARTKVGAFKAANFLDDILGGFTDADIGSINDPNAMSLVAYKQGLLNKDGTLTGKGKNFATQYGDEIDFLGIDDFGSYLEGIKGGVEGTQSQRAIDRKNFYLGNKNFTNSTSGQAEQLAGEQLYSTDDMSKMGEKEAYRAKMFNRKVIEARDIASRGKDNNNQNRRPAVMEQAEAEVIETPDGVIDEEAQTMKYTSPRTGDKEIDVPLQRRFKTDPTQDVAQYTTTPRTESDILKYMTQGTTGEGIGLEPFSEYQRRRRKAMGLDPLELYG